MRIHIGVKFKVYQRYKMQILSIEIGEYTGESVKTITVSTQWHVKVSLSVKKTNPI